MARVFLSHSSADKPFVRELHRRLTRDGVDCFFDAESIGWGENWVLALERALDACEFVVVVLSPDFCSSEWAQRERTSSMAAGAGGAKAQILPLTLKPCRHLATFPRFLRDVQALDVSTSDRFEKQYPRICRKLGGTPGEDFEFPVDRSKLPTVTALPARHRMPHASIGRRFAGRVAALWDLHDLLWQGQTAVVQGVGVVHGTGGLGKTQLAIEYVHRFGAGYPGGVYWIEADQGRPRLLAVVGEAARLGIDPARPEAEQLEAVWQGLAALPASLVVLDNFPESDPLRPWLPATGPIHVLVTTRRTDLPFDHLGLEVLSTAEGLYLLNSGERSFGAEAEPLVEAVGGLPLALELTRAYLDADPAIEPADVLEEIERVGEMEILEEFAEEYRAELPTGHERNVAATFRMSWERLGEAEKAVLMAMSTLAPAPVPRDLLRRILGLQKRRLRDPLGRRITALKRNSLVELSTGDQAPGSHRLVLAFARHTSPASSELLAATARGLSAEIETRLAGATADRFSLLEPLLSHLIAAASQSLKSPDAGAALSRSLSVLCFDIGGLLTKLGQSAMAGLLLRQDLAIAERLAQQEPDRADYQRDLSVSFNKLGDLLLGLGQGEEAKTLYQQSLDIRKRLAQQEPDRADYQRDLSVSFNKLGDLLLGLGQGEEAKTLYQQSLDIRKRLAQQEPDRADYQRDLSVSFNKLGDLLLGLGQGEEAKTLYQQSLDIAERLAQQEPDRADYQRDLSISYERLGDLLRGLGQGEEAKTLYQQSLDIAERLAQQEPDRADYQRDLSISYERLGDLLRGLGQGEEAKTLYQQSLDIRKRLAQQEPDRADYQRDLSISYERLGDLLRGLGQGEEAKTLYQQSLDIRKRLAQQEPDRADLQEELVVPLHRLGQWDSGRWRQALEILEGLDRANRLTTVKRGWIETLKRLLGDAD